MLLFWKLKLLMILSFITGEKYKVVINKDFSITILGYKLVSSHLNKELFKDRKFRKYIYNYCDILVGCEDGKYN